LVGPGGLEEKYRGGQVIEAMNRSRALHMKSAERRFIEANWSTPFLALILRSSNPSLLGGWEQTVIQSTQ